ncbi:MAG: glutaredoxin family protein [Betaproteobacteria bacterium]
METDEGPRLTVYGRSHCHLCETMVAQLRTLQDAYRFGLEVVDIDRDAALAQLYGDRVPVLACEGRELCHYRLDAPAVTAFLGNIR